MLMCACFSAAMYVCVSAEATCVSMILRSLQPERWTAARGSIQSPSSPVVGATGVAFTGDLTSATPSPLKAAQHSENFAARVSRWLRLALVTGMSPTCRGRERKPPVTNSKPSESTIFWNGFPLWRVAPQVASEQQTLACASSKFQCALSPPSRTAAEPPRQFAEIWPGLPHLKQRRS